MKNRKGHERGAHRRKPPLNKKVYPAPVMAAAKEAVEKIIPHLQKIHADLSRIAFQNFDRTGFSAKQYAPEDVENFMRTFIERVYRPVFNHHEYSIQLHARQVSETTIEILPDNLQTFITLAGRDIPPPLAGFTDPNKWESDEHIYENVNGVFKLYRKTNSITFTGTIDPEKLKEILK